MRLVQIIKILGIILALIILISIAIVLYLKNKKLKTKISEENKKYNIYKQKIKKIKTSKNAPDKNFENLSTLIKEFLRKYFNMKESLSYNELAQEFKKQNKKELAEFCEIMAETSYQNEKITQIKINKLIDKFNKIFK